MSGARRPPAAASVGASHDSRALHDSSVRLALRKEEAARALGVSDETFDRYARPELPVVRLGTVRVYPVAALEAFLAERAVSPADELGRRRRNAA